MWQVTLRNFLMGYQSIKTYTRLYLFLVLKCWLLLSAVSGRSSAIGDVTVDSAVTGGHSDVGSVVAGTDASVGGAVTLDSDALEAADYDFNRHVHVLRLRILDKLVGYLPELRDVGGVRAIPFMQVCRILFMKRS